MALVSISGIFSSAGPGKNSLFLMLFLMAFSRASLIASGRMSTPRTWPHLGQN